VFSGPLSDAGDATELARHARKVARCGRHFQLLDAILADRQFLCGGSLTLADVPTGTALFRYFELEIERPSVPNVEAWYRRLQNRRAYREHVMVPFEELCGRLDY
jgi:glutathione S-transferase